MNAAIFETVSPAITEVELPCRLEQSSSRLRPAVLLALLAPVALLAVSPFILIATHVAAAPAGLDLLAERPGATLQTLLGLTLAIAVIGWPLARIVERLGRHRSVEIASGHVNVAERGPLGSRSWSVPLASYAGVAHHIRTTMSITRHELMLVHPDPRRHVLLMVADRISKGDVEAVAARLGLGEVSPRLLYARSSAAPDRSSHAGGLADDALQPVRA